MCKSPDNALVSQVSVKILDANENRRGLFLCNMSKKTIWIGLDHDAEEDKGIVLASGLSFSMTSDDFSRADIYAISDGNDSLITIQEFETLPPGGA